MESSEIKFKSEESLRSVYSSLQKNSVRVVLSLRPLKSLAGARQLTQQKRVEAGNYTTIKIPKT
jgi:hypothetical protein